MLMLAAMNSVFILENPFSSLMFEYQYVREMAVLLKKAGVKAGPFFSKQNS